jgi:hypothetical protein
MEYPGGYVRIYRKLLDQPIWTQLAPAVLKVAIFCILRANYRRFDWYDGVKTVEISAGSFVTSYAKAAAACGLSIQQIRDAFSHLERTHFATFVRTHRWTLVTVRNYETYQATLGEENTPKSKTTNTSENRQGPPNEEIEIEPVPSSDQSGVSPSLVLIPPKPKKTRATTHQPYAEVLRKVACAIHDRHPDAYERRNLDVAGTEKRLVAILRHQHVPTVECEAYLQRVDRNHVAACQSEKWCKNGGEFVKNLRGWLNPSEGLYLSEPPKVAQAVPPRLMA